MHRHTELEGIVDDRTGKWEIESNEATLRFVGVAAYALPRDWIRSFASLVALGILESPRLLHLR
jgi:hypothetical protein